ncbi:hypothetical protein HDU96_010506 [Phlyctochytrium bullatum]|nr:hypothetical protein HDU96_010506 [Phlyctochytrium bullatum]
MVKNFTAVESVYIARAYKRISTDAAVGIEQDGTEFYKRIYDTWLASIKDTADFVDTRSATSIRGRWLNHIQKAVLKFTGHVNKAFSSPGGSGWSFDNFFQLAKKTYLTDAGKHFQYETCWFELKDLPKFEPDYNMLPDATRRALNFGVADDAANDNAADDNDSQPDSSDDDDGHDGGSLPVSSLRQRVGGATMASAAARTPSARPVDPSSTRSSSVVASSSSAVASSSSAAASSSSAGSSSSASVGSSSASEPAVIKRVRRPDAGKKKAKARQRKNGTVSTLSSPSTKAANAKANFERVAALKEMAAASTARAEIMREEKENRLFRTMNTTAANEYLRFKAEKALQVARAESLEAEIRAANLALQLEQLRAEEAARSRRERTPPDSELEVSTVAADDFVAGGGMSEEEEEVPLMGRGPRSGAEHLQSMFPQRMVMEATPLRSARVPGRVGTPGILPVIPPIFLERTPTPRVGQRGRGDGEQRALETRDGLRPLDGSMHMASHLWGSPRPFFAIPEVATAVNVGVWGGASAAGSTAVNVGVLGGASAAGPSTPFGGNSSASMPAFEGMPSAAPAAGNKINIDSLLASDAPAEEGSGAGL